MRCQSCLLVLLFAMLFLSCSSPAPLLQLDNDELVASAPTQFTVQFTTTKGIVKIEVQRDYSPLAVDRFYYLAKHNYYDGNRFFRVVPKFVVQWGMNGTPKIDSLWENMGVPDEPVLLSNKKGVVSFARSGPNTRSNQLFINLVDNIRLDSSEYNNVLGFPGFGKVVDGMDVVESINSEYKELPNQDSILVKGNNYLDKNFPTLDYIISTKMISEK